MLRAVSTLILVTLAILPAQSPRLPPNGGFEATTAEHLGQSRRDAYYSLPGWQTTAGGWVAQTGTYYKVRAAKGRRFLRPKQGDGRRCELTQTVPLTAFGTTRPRALLAELRMRTGIGKDRTEVVYEILDAGGKVLHRRSSGPCADTEWTAHRHMVRLTTTATALRIRLIGHHHAGKITDAFFDDLQLQGVGPGYPKTLAGQNSKQLIAAHRAAADQGSRQSLLLALAGADNSAAQYLVKLHRAASSPQHRSELLRLLLLSGHKAAAAPLRAALTGSDQERATVLQDLDLAPFDWAGQVAGLALHGRNHRSEYLEALARHGAIAKLNVLFGVGRSELRLLVLKALDQGSFTAEQLKLILATNLRSNGDAEQRYLSMRLLARSRGARYLTVLAAMCRLESSLTRRGHYLRWAAEYNSLAAIQAMLPLVERKLARCPGAFLEWAPAMTDPRVGNWWRQAAASHSDPLLREAAVAALRLQPRPDDLAHLATLSQDPVDAVAIAAIHAMAGAPAAAAQLHQLVLNKSGLRAAAALGALASSAAAGPELITLAAGLTNKARDWRLRVAAIRILASQAAQHRALLRQSLKARSRQVRTAAIQALGQARDTQTIEILLQHLDTERSTTRAFLIATLSSLTGVDKGDDAALWRDWWTTVGPGFQLPPLAAKPPQPRPAKATVSTFYDLPVQTDKVVFVIDVSGSMKTEVRGDTKLATAKDQVVKVLRAMQDSRHSFNIITFGSTPKAYHKTLQRASRDKVRKAVQWLMRQPSKGWTNIYDSLYLAMRMPGVESIFLLSDGAPSTGRYVNMPRLRAAIAEQNRHLMIRINTISVGGDQRSRRFMRRLATENHGNNRDQD